MSSYRTHEDELRGEFERVLNELVLKGHPPPAEHPFDWHVIGVLKRIAEFPQSAGELVEESRRLLERQIRRWPAHRLRRAG